MGDAENNGFMFILIMILVIGITLSIIYGYWLRYDLVKYTIKLDTISEEVMDKSLTKDRCDYFLSNLVSTEEIRYVCRDKFR